MDYSMFVSEAKYKYYYNLLNASHKLVYDALLRGYLAQDAVIFVDIENPQDIFKISNYVLFDIPEIFYLIKIKIRYSEITTRVKVIPEYRFSTEKRDQVFAQLMNRAHHIEEYAQKLSGDMAKVKFFHDYLVEYVTYKDPDIRYSHELPGALLYGVAVCEGISKAFKFFCDRASIKCILVTGKSSEDADCGHAWNIVYVNNIPFHIDVTFDNNLTKDGNIRYDYYLLSDKQISSNHIFNNMPDCTVNYEFYQYVKNRIEFEKILMNAQFKVPLVLKLPEIVGSDALEILKPSIDKILAQRYSSYRYSYSINIHRKIFQLSLKR